MKFLKFWFPVFLYSGIIYYVSSVPELSIPGQLKIDKVLHLIEYIPFGFWAARALSSSGQKNIRLLLETLLLTVVLGCLDEFHQLSVMGRSCDIDDALVDSVGGLLGAVIFWVSVKGWLPEVHI